MLKKLFEKIKNFFSKKNADVCGDFLILSKQDFDLLTNAIDNPPGPNSQLRAAVEMTEKEIVKRKNDKSKSYVLEGFKGKSGWYFRLRHRNKNIIMCSESYSSKQARNKSLYNLALTYGVTIKSLKD